jgi:hypothetical protein
MNDGIKLAAAAALCALAAAPARAQVVNLSPPPQLESGWTFAVTPYAWLPMVSSTYSYQTPRGGTVTNTISAGIGEYLTDINSVVFIGGAARNDRFSVLTDLVYANASLTTDRAHFSTLNLGGGPIHIPRELQLDTGTRLATTIWSLAGGYTVLEGDWGNVDAVAGMRILFFGSTTNYLLGADIFLPDHTIGLSRNGGLNIGRTEPEGVGGLTGRINIPNSNFYVPFYADVGGGAVPLTWQVYGAIAYKIASYADVSVGYRNLAFSNGNRSNGVEKLNLGGALIAATFHF